MIFEWEIGCLLKSVCVAYWQNLAVNETKIGANQVCKSKIVFWPISAIVTL
jgi:hypothetical protein